MEGTRKDLTLHYAFKSSKIIYEDPREFEGIQYFGSFSYEKGKEDNITKIDYVSYFTKTKDNKCEHRIYQIGSRYSNKEKRTLETLLRENEKEGDFAPIINTLRKILKLNPNEYKRWNRLGELLVKTEQYDDAIEACKRAIKLVGIFTPAWICLYMAYYGKANTEKAKKLIKKTLDDDPSYLNALESMAQIHFKEKEFDKALEYCNQHLECDYSDNKKDSKEIFKLTKIIKLKLGIQEKLPKEQSENKEWDEAFIKLAQRLYNDNIEYIEYIEYLKRSDLHNLKRYANGKIIEEKSLVFCREAIINFFEKRFPKAYIESNTDKKDFKNFFDDIYPKLVINLEVFYGIETLISLINTLISNTTDVAYIYIPLPFPEILSFISEWTFKNKEKKIVFYSFWEEAFFDKIYSGMDNLGNIQVRRLGAPYSFFVALRDEKELILTPFSNNLESIISIKSKDSELIHFYKKILITILNEDSIPINFEELKALDKLNKFLDGLPKNQ